MKEKGNRNCFVYSSLCNYDPRDRGCTYGYGNRLIRKGDYSEELKCGGEK